MTVQAETIASLIGAGNEVTSLTASDTIVVERAGVLYGISLANAGFGIPGEYKEFAMATPPSGWLECDGAAVSRTTYANLFSAIGTLYGTGDGSTTFNLPDFRDKHAEGASATNAVGDSLAAEVGPHNHAAGTLATASDGSHSHDLNFVQFIGQAGGTGGLIFGSGSSATTAAAGAHTHAISGSTANNSGTVNRPDSISVLRCIKY